MRLAVVQKKKEDVGSFHFRLIHSAFNLLLASLLGLSDEEASTLLKLSQRPGVIDFVSKEGFLPLLPFKEEIERTQVFMQ